MKEEHVSTELAIPVAEFTPKQKHLYNESLALFARGTQAGWIENVLKAASLYNIKTFGLHAIDGNSWDEHLQKIGMSDRSGRRYIQIAERMKDVCCKVLRSTGEDPGEWEFAFNFSLIKQGFDKFFSSGIDITLRGLAENAGTLQQFENYLSGNSELTDKELTKLLAPPKRKVEELPPATPTAQDTLFSTHERILAAGYLFDKELRRYVNPDGTPLTAAQLGPFVDEESAMKVFTATQNILTDSLERITQTIGDYGIFFQAHAECNQSPAAKKKFEDQFRDTLMHAKKLAGILTNIWGEE